MPINLTFLKKIFKNLSEDTIYDIETHLLELVYGAAAGVAVTGSAILGYALH